MKNRSYVTKESVSALGDHVGVCIHTHNHTISPTRRAVAAVAWVWILVRQAEGGRLIPTRTAAASEYQTGRVNVFAEGFAFSQGQKRPPALGWWLPLAGSLVATCLLLSKFGFYRCGDELPSAEALSKNRAHLSLTAPGECARLCSINTGSGC